ncbi:MAG: stage II sporulation protein M [Desulfurococcales archaeon]|nr:stage II sporulation protein M [Desulfurococcales archaeon]MCE4605123.1 stage II sporulation protein M [Desulfurococcales archaeon]
MVASRAEGYIYSRGFLGDWLLSTMIIVALMIIVSAAYPIIAESSIGKTIREQLDQLLEGADETPLDPISLMSVIILNNIRVAIIIVLTSPTLALPLVIEAFQGAAIGYMISATLYGDYLTASAGIPIIPLVIHYGLVPHGAVEIPAISLLVAPILGVRRYGFKKAIVYSISMLPLTIVMLIVAGVVESTVTIVLILLISIIVAFKLLV